MVQNQTMHRLRAEDVEDLAVIAALMQDAVTRIGDMAYDRDESTFMLAATRFRRETATVDDRWTKVSSALIFKCIKTVQYRGIQADDAHLDLTLLTIATEPGADTLYRIDLVFEGGGEIRLTSDCMHCRFEDFGDIELSDKSPSDHFEDDAAFLNGGKLGSMG